MADPRIAETFNRLIELHARKNADYANKRHYENFEIAAKIMEFFEKPQDKVFANIIGIKIARLAALFNSGRTPSNETVDDTFDDLTIYIQLWKNGREDVMAALGMDQTVDGSHTHTVLICTCGHLHSMHRPYCNTVGCSCKQFINKLDMR